MRDSSQTDNRGRENISVEVKISFKKVARADLVSISLSLVMSTRFDCFVSVLTTIDPLLASSSIALHSTSHLTT